MSFPPIVSIVGRTNVGKSSLFNRIIKNRIAIVEDSPGVTRDRNYHASSWCGISFMLVDTGGLIPTSKESIPTEIHKQVDIAIEESTAIIFLVEALPGPTDIDLLIAQRLRKNCPEKVILTVNKTESQEAANEAHRHISLGCGDYFPISAIHGKGIGDLLDRVCEILKEQTYPEESLQEQVDLSLAVVGRPNAGKSSLINKLLNDERMIVDDIPGTTRDAIDSILTYNTLRIRLIDTAGLRKKNQVHNDVEYYSNLRALGSIRRCDICILLIDTKYGIGEQDLKICSHVIKHKKGLVICWNKWDLIEKDSKTFDRLVAETKKTYREAQYTPMTAISALSGQRVTTIIDNALQIKEVMKKRIKPSELRGNFFSWIKTYPHPYFSSSKEVRFLGIKQIPTEYPHFTFFCTNPVSIVPSYRRFLMNKFQETYDFSGCPIVLTFKPAGKSFRKREHSPDNNSEKE